VIAEVVPLAGLEDVEPAGVLIAPIRRPTLQVHLGDPIRLTGDVATATARALAAVQGAWRQAVSQVR
jgi:hypothetical protein